MAEAEAEGGDEDMAEAEAEGGAEAASPVYDMSLAFHEGDPATWGEVRDSNPTAASALDAAARPRHPLPLNSSQQGADGSQQALVGRTATSMELRGGSALGRACLAMPSSASDPRRPPNPGLARVVGQYLGLSTVDPTDSGHGYRFSPDPNPPPPAMRTAEGSRRQVQVVEEAACPGYILTGPAHEPLWSRGVIGGSPSALSQDMGSPSGNAHGRPAPRRR